MKWRQISTYPNDGTIAIFSKNGTTYTGWRVGNGLWYFIDECTVQEVHGLQSSLNAFREDRPPDKWMPLPKP